MNRGCHTTICVTSMSLFGIISSHCRAMLPQPLNKYPMNEKQIAAQINEQPLQLVWCAAPDAPTSFRRVG